MGVGSAISFLSYHCPDYFTDITEMSRAFDLFSEADLFANKCFQGDGHFPMDYASSIGSRSIADTNKTPAPSAFRQLSAPKVFAVMKKSSENEVKMDQLRKRLLGSGKIAFDSNIGSSNRFVTESLPHMRFILPDEVNYALAHLHSYFNDGRINDAADTTSQEEAVAKEYEALLEDDIVDDDDDDW
jgi:cell cycle checkpoint protein